MQYKNIIFDLGNVLVKLNPEGCIGAFKAIGMGELANPNPQSEGMKLMSKLGVGMITTEAFCDAARELTGTDVKNEEIIDAANKKLMRARHTPLAQLTVGFSATCKPNCLAKRMAPHSSSSVGVASVRQSISSL